MEHLLVVGGITACVLVLYSVLAFLLARLKEDNSVMDVLYGPAFTVSLLCTAILVASNSVITTLVLSAITLWSLRLGIRIFRKNFNKPEDARYAKWREQWMENGRWYFLVRSYLQVNLLQCAIIVIVSLPGIVAIAFGTTESVNWFIATAGLLIFLFGLVYETTADWQLDAFIKDKQAGRSDETLMRRGLFYFSRRPNYFGESLIWWGLAIAVCTLPLGWVAFLSPLTITYILTKVTGPMLENQFLEKYPDEYREYMRTTNYLVPGKPKAAAK